MRDQMPYDQKMMMEAVGFAAQLLTPQADNLAALVRAEQQSHSHLHVTDPALYRRTLSDKNFKAQIDLAKAALAFVLAVQQVKSDLGVGGSDNA